MRLRADPPFMGTLAAFVTVCGYFALTTEGFATVDTTRVVLQGLAATGIGALALGVTMLAGELDVAVPSIATVAALVGMKFGGDHLLGVLGVAIVVGLIIGVAQGFIIYAVAINSLVFTLGSLIALQGVGLMIAGQRSVPSPDLRWASDLQRPLLSIFTPLTLVAIACFSMVGFFLTFTRRGREHLAIGGGRIEAIAAGVSLRRTIVTAFALSGALSGLAGGLVSIRTGSASATLFDGLLLPAVTAALLGGISLSGGKGRVVGIAIGTITLTALTSGMALRGAPFYMPGLATAALLLVVLAIELGSSARDLGARLAGLTERLRQRENGPSVARSPDLSPSAHVRSSLDRAEDRPVR